MNDAIHAYNNVELWWLRSTLIYEMHEGVGGWTKGHLGCRTPKDEAAYSVKGTVYNS